MTTRPTQSLARSGYVRYASIMADRISEDRQEIAEATQRVLVAVALQAYAEAGLSGLCAEGRWEAAVGAMRSYDVRPISGDTE